MESPKDFERIKADAYSENAATQANANKELLRWIQTISRNDPAALPALAECLEIPELCFAAVKALAERGDARAIPHLEPLLTDTTPQWEMDDRALPPRLCDAARDAIQRLRDGGDGRFIPGSSAPVTRRGWFLRSIAPYVPLALGMLDIPWSIMVMLSQIGGQGNYKNDPNYYKPAIFFCALPVVFGFVIGLYVLARRWVSGPAQWVCLSLGVLVCGSVAIQICRALLN